MKSTVILAVCVSLLLVASNRGGEAASGGGSRGLAAGGGSDVAEVLPVSLRYRATEQVSHRKPEGLILSTGNLYFTSQDAAGAAVWRTSQTSSPGQETILYWEPGAEFGDIVFAQVDGTFFGYFFATKSVNRSVVTIKRVPLTGGPATTLATLTNIDIANSHRNLVTDGASLFWQTDTSVRKMPIRGGPVTVLDRTDFNTPTAGLVLQNARIIYASVNKIRFVPGGGAITAPEVRTITTAGSRVTALHAVSNGIYWGEQSGAVRLKVGTAISTLPSTPNLPPSSISSSGFTAGASQAWTQCASQSCRLHFENAVASGVAVPVGGDALGVTITSAGRVFWGDTAGVHRRTF